MDTGWIFLIDMVYRRLLLVLEPKATEPVRELETVLQSRILPPTLGSDRPYTQAPWLHGLQTNSRGVSRVHAGKLWQHSDFLRPHFELRAALKGMQLNRTAPGARCASFITVRSLKWLSGVSLLSQIELAKINSDSLCFKLSHQTTQQTQHHEYSRHPEPARHF